jgi:hypothetical protein
MRKRMFVALLLSAAGRMYGADPFCDGTYKLNVAKSHFTAAPEPAPKEITVVCKAEGDHYDLTIKGTDGKGAPISVHQLNPKNGGEVKFIEGGPPRELKLTSIYKKIDDLTREESVMRDGKELFSGRMVVSKDGKTVRRTLKGHTADGKPIDGFEIYEKQ